MIYAPNTAEEAASFLRERQTPVKITYSVSSSSNEDILSLEKLNSVLLYEPEEMIISVGAGITLQELERTLSDRGQWVPTLVASEVPESALGDAIVNDHYHPRAKTCGMLRTSILGGTFCTTNGDLFKSGSRVVKSVAGYDIHRAFCGSKGTFGAIISLTLKVQSRPEIFFRFVTSARHLTDLRQFSPTIVENADNYLIVELGGYKEDVEYDISQLRASGIIEKEFDNSEWEAILANIRASKHQAQISEEVSKLLTEVRHVFDPKNILR